jgi:phage terminase large subunit
VSAVPGQVPDGVFSHRDDGQVLVPVDWAPRPYQMPLWSFLENGGKRAVAIWHRRAGKDATSLNWTVVSSLRRVGLYWHLLPTYNQGRKIVWDGRTKEGRPFLSAFPRDLVKSVNNTDMKLELTNGSIWQVVGTDNVDRLVGANPVGVVFSEYSLQDPRAWDYIRPILMENGGWAVFIYTPRGKNHGWDLYKMALSNPGWFCQKLDGDDTGIVTPEMVAEEREAGMQEELIRQEFYCSFEAGMVGSYYGNILSRLVELGHVTRVPHDPRLPVITGWDLGMDDSTAIWFAQRARTEVRIIDYYENCGEGLAHYVKVLTQKSDLLNYNYEYHYAPHDIEVRELGTGKSRKEIAGKLGLKFHTVPKLPVEDGVEAVRGLLPTCYFDKGKTDKGFDALMNYRKEWDDKRRTFLSKPEHDWTSHGADAFRTLAVGLKRSATRTLKLVRTADSNYNPLRW